MKWTAIPGGWRRADGKVLMRPKKSGRPRNAEAAAMMLGLSLVRTATCRCGWSHRAADLGAANEAWWAHEEVTATDGRAHAVSYSEAGT